MAQITKHQAHLIAAKAYIAHYLIGVILTGQIKGNS